VVVFSQRKNAVKHADFVLSHAGVPHVTICKGDQQAAQEVAVATWTSRPACRVFLLHAGAAAAGLTLVAARHVILLEPFDKPGQELQALNRCHRIGQARPVTCAIYYAQRTLEERLLAYRTLEQHQQPTPRGGELGPDGEEAEAIALIAEGSALPNPQKLRYLFGMLRGKNAHSGEDDDADGEGDDDDEGGQEEEEGEEEDSEEDMDYEEDEGEEDLDDDDEDDDDDDEDEDEDENEVDGEA
jgi:hypothetical protein